MIINDLKSREVQNPHLKLLFFLDKWTFIVIWSSKRRFLTFYFCQLSWNNLNEYINAAHYA